MALPRISRRFVLMGAAVGGLLLLGLAIVLSVSWSSPRLGRAVLAKAGDLAGVELSATDFRLSLLRGLELRGVDIHCPLEAGYLAAKMDRLVLEHRLLPLLGGKVVVDRLVLERPEIELVSGAAVAPTPTVSAAPGATQGEGPRSVPEEAGGGGLDVELARIAISDGSVLVRDTALPAPVVDLRGLDFELRDLRLDGSATSMLQGLTATGDLTAERAVLDVLDVHDLRGKVRLEGGHVVLHDLEAPANLGRFRIAELDLDLEQDPYAFRVALSADPLAAGEIVGAVGKALGAARLVLETSGGLGETFDLDGRGTLSLEIGRLPESPVLSAIDGLLRGLPVVGAAYEPFDIHFRLDGESIVADLFEIKTPDLRLAAQGVVGLDESLDLRFVARAARELLAESDVPPEVLEALTDADGQVNLPLQVRGNRSDPVAVFDRSQWASMARERIKREAGKEVEKQVGRALGRLLGGNEDDG